MNDMETNEQNLTALVGCIELVADAIVKKTCPSMDDISENQAKARYGSKWIRFHKERGNLRHHYRGRRIVYSIHEINCLRAAEKDSHEAIMRMIEKKPE